MIADLYDVRLIERRRGLQFIIKHHYLHRQCPASWCYGLFHKNTDRLIGVIIYGVPQSWSLKKGIAGLDNSLDVGELMRLFVIDGTPKNTESYFIAQTLNRVPYKIIVSFADTSFNHIGVVYQATNFLYTGTSAKVADAKHKDNQNTHHVTSGKGKTIVQLRAEYGENLVYVPRSVKHRYVYLRGDKREKARLRRELKYPVMPYPKA